MMDRTGHELPEFSPHGTPYEYLVVDGVLYRALVFSNGTTSFPERVYSLIDAEGS